MISLSYLLVKKKLGNRIKLIFLSFNQKGIITWYYNLIKIIELAKRFLIVKYELIRNVYHFMIYRNLLKLYQKSFIKLRLSTKTNIMGVTNKLK